ncbi:MAG: hypothetical protein P8X79_13550 [Reinekea sp.]
MKSSESKKAPFTGATTEPASSNFNEPMGAPAIFEKQIEIKLLHPASTLESRIQVISKTNNNEFTMPMALALQGSAVICKSLL